MEQKTKTRRNEKDTSQASFLKAISKKNPERMKEYQRRYRERNREKILAKKKEYYESNGDMLVEKSRQWRKGLSGQEKKEQMKNAKLGETQILKEQGLIHELDTEDRNKRLLHCSTMKTLSRRLIALF